VAVSDEENLELASSPGDVDTLNQAFYGRFPYPWPPQLFPRVAHRGLERIMLNQSIGRWRQDLIRDDARIWVAGCGTNQAIYTALKFPDASIVASDISAASLDISRKTAAALGLGNIDFRQESLNQVDYAGAFDLVICTGVIHHNADPAATLGRIARGLKPQGVLELMVYNRYQRLLTSAVQRTVRIFSRAAGQETDFDAEFRIAKAIIDTGPLAPNVKDHFKAASDAEFADTWLQPVEHSYTVESLGEMAAACGLRLLAPCLTHFDLAGDVFSWDVSFDDPAMQGRYDGLDDKDRWQVGNLLLAGRSPMLWFYLSRQDMDFPRNAEKAMCDEFLTLRFERVLTSVRLHQRDDGGGYRPVPGEAPHPRPPEIPLIRQILERASPARTMREVLSEVGVDAANRKLVNEIRVLTTSPLCPYLKAVV
jgi:SAM-dependent methyltransferase